MVECLFGKEETRVQFSLRAFSGEKEMAKDIYLSKHEELLKVRAEGNEELEDQILDELDKIWFVLSEKEQSDRFLSIIRAEV